MESGVSPKLTFAISILLLSLPVAYGIASEVPAYSSHVQIDQPVIFGKGIVSTELPEFASAFSPVGNMVVFNRMPADRSSIEMYISTFENGRWNTAELLPFSGMHNDVDPFFTSDGSRLYFSSDRTIDPEEEAGNWDTWYVDRIANGWSAPVRLGPEVNTDATEIFVSLTDEGTLYFRRSSDTSRDIYRAKPKDGGFLPAEKIQGLGLEKVGNPMIAKDESYLILSVAVEGSAGELFISFPDGDHWTPAINMGPSVNTMYAEFAPSISPDGKYLFFTSERPGMLAETPEGRPPGDIYQIELREIDGIDWPD